MAAKLPFVSLITLNWNGEHYLKKLLPKLENQSYPRDAYEIIVVDNDSTKDDSVNFVKSNFPNVVLIENTRNDGFARGCNLGMQEAKGDYLLLVNNDTEPDKTWLEELVNTAEKHQAGAAVSKLMFANRPGIINNAGSTLLPDKTWPVVEIGANEKDAPEFNQEREITALCGASLLLSRKMLDDIGLFDEAFFMYFEDSDLSWRGQDKGWKFYYSPASVIYHEHSGSSKEHSDFWTFHVARNRMLILLKHARAGIFLRAYAGLVRDFLVKPVWLGLKRHERRHQLHTIRLGLKIQWSFIVRVPGALMKRWHLMHEPQLKAAV